MPGLRISIVLSAALGGSPQLEAGSTQQFGQKKTPQAGENPAKEAASQLTARKKPCTERVMTSVRFFFAAPCPVREFSRKISPVIRPLDYTTNT